MKLIGGFDWDHGNREKCQRHGVTIPEIEAAFQATIEMAPDPSHSGSEDRFRTVYRTAKGRALFVVFTLRHAAGKVLVRPISARFMHRKEIDSYEEAISRIHER